MALGIDISENNHFGSWDKVLDSGVEFAIIRAGYGQGNLDSEFYQNVREAQKLGLKLGAYWFSYALDVDQAYEEGVYCREIIDKTGALFELPIFFDQEDSDWRTNHGYDHSLATDQCDAFAQGLDGLNCGIYANEGWFTYHMDYHYLSSNYTIWLAQYAPQPDYCCGIWQYTDKGTIGDDYPIDLNTAKF